MSNHGNGNGNDHAGFASSTNRAMGRFHRKRWTYDGQSAPATA